MKGCQPDALPFREDRQVSGGGRFRGDSDVDLLVVMRYKGHSARMAAAILNKLEPEFSVDLIVRTPSELRKRLAQQDQFLAQIVRNGKVLYEAAHA